MAREHLVAAAGGWSLWRTAVLRGAGFPVAELLRLTTRETARLVDAGEPSVEAALMSERRVISDVLREVARHPRFREALLWQNANALKNGVDPLLRQPQGSTNYKTRRLEHLVANYLQRYAAKNDTIGFFGPVGWASLDDRCDGFRAHAGPSLLKKRTVYFEHWGIDALAQLFGEDPELRRWCVPRRNPTLFLEGQTLHHSIGKRSELPEPAARLLAACDGERSAEQIVDMAVSAGQERDEAWQLLEELSDERVIYWSFELPTTDPRPEGILRRQLGAQPESAAREEALAQLTSLEEALAAVAKSAGDPAALSATTQGLDEKFAAITQKAASRRGGQIYAARTLFYEDCVRDVEVTLGKAVYQRLATPLSLLLQTARWYTHQIAARYRRSFDTLFDSFGAPEVEYLRFWEKASALFPNKMFEMAPIVAEVAAEVQRRWAAILRIEEGARRVQCASSAIAGAVADAFSAPHPGWPGARYHSPDVMLAARDADAIARGDYLAVLGELHCAVNTTCLPLFLVQHPTPDALLRAREEDIDQVCVAPVTPRDRATRSDHNWLSRQNVDLEIGDTRSFRPRSQVIAVGELVLERNHGKLIVRTRDRRRSFDVIAFFEYYLIAESMIHCSPIASESHSPRVTIDNFVISREKWRFLPAQLPFIATDVPLTRFVEARRWAASHRLPRFIFISVPEEPKPCYIDLESPIFIEILAQLGRKCSVLKVSEMLPAPDECWLADAEGNRYTAELRLSAVDPEPFVAP